MNNLSITDNETMGSLELLEQINAFREQSGLSDIRNNDFNARIEDEIDDLSGYETFVSDTGGTPKKWYRLTRRQCLLIGMRESKQVRKNVLLWLESLADKSHQIPQTYSAALLLAGQQAEQIEVQNEALKIAAPKVEFVDRFVESTGNKTFREVAKLLKANEREFRTFLHESKVMYRLGDGWTAHANHIDAGRFYVTGGEANGHAFTTCKFTPKGIEYIAGKWITREVKPVTI